MLRSITDPSALPAEPLITTVTLAELSAAPLVRTATRNVRPDKRISSGPRLTSLPFDAAAARAFGQVAASLRRSGRKVAARNYDAMIAAIAIANGLAVHTCNPAGFEGVDGLSVTAVPHPGQPNTT